MNHEPVNGGHTTVCSGGSSTTTRTQLVFGERQAFSNNLITTHVGTVKWPKPRDEIVGVIPGRNCAFCFDRHEGLFDDQSSFNHHTTRGLEDRRGLSAGGPVATCPCARTNRKIIAVGRGHARSRQRSLAKKHGVLFRGPCNDGSTGRAIAAGNDSRHPHFQNPKAEVGRGTFFVMMVPSHKDRM
jgi:hypothetical protein